MTTKDDHTTTAPAGRPTAGTAPAAGAGGPPGLDPPRAGALGVAAVRVPAGGLRHNARAARVVWQRELIRFFRDRTRIVSALVQPVLFLFVLGTGLSQLTSQGTTGGISFRTYIFPGVLAMATLFTSFFSAGSIVFDREFGFLREMLVAPVSRAAIVVGKVLGGASVATFQGILILCLGGLVDVPYDPVLLLTLVGELMLLSFALTAFGVMLAARIQQIQSFMGLVQVFLMPMFFLSGALYPLSRLPGWLHVLTHVNPMTYIVDPMRRAVLSHVHVAGSAAPAAAGPGGASPLRSTGVSWWGWSVPTLLELAIVLLIGLLTLAVAIGEFSRPE